MARGLFMGRPRATREPGISSPVFKYPDALPRNDLKGFGNVSTSHHPSPQQVHCDVQRPRTSEGRHQDRRVETPGPGFDFQIAVPPPEAIPSPTDTDDGEGNYIGIALGSPRLVDTPNTFAQMQEKALVTARETSKPSQLQRKPSKWRKIGGLFKAKHAAASGVNQPFYQVQVPGSNGAPIQGSSHSVDYQAREPKTRPIINTEVWPCLEPEAKPAEQKQQSTTHEPPQKSQQPESQLGPLLQVDIPNVEMERYSVMFSALLNQGEPSPMDRRSKTLGNASVPNLEEPQDLPEMQPPRRRATSPTPTRSNSPRLSLFPATQKSKASKVLGSQNLPRVPCAVPRLQTSRAESRQEESTNEQSHVVVMLHSESASPTMGHRPQNSVSSYLSTTSIGSDDEKLLLQKLKPVQTYVDPKGEPEWEMVSRKSPTTETRPKLAPLNTQELPPEHASSASTASSPILSPLAAVSKKFSPTSPTNDNKTTASPAAAIRNPLIDEITSDKTNKDEADPPSPAHNEDDDPEPEPEPETLPTIEISIARSVSVSKGRRQVIVPVGRRGDRLTPDDRAQSRMARTPRVMNGEHGHRHGNSQDARIESV
ncbi:hypothetical protein BDV25DRAFT_166782 [Aspergillus avenaceus]|uniref:Uncharacterized protein n=1 Tax=Aspergillus avenaceus TaxID=36643 RepID=A0A5N6TDQ2_ASPAV|nr:hypothetical protein BDV25DRAFT_166782 [Aspergillus avenaceus]